MATKGSATLTQVDMLRTKYKDEYEVEYQQLQARVQPYTTIVTGMEGDRYEFPVMGGTDMREYSGYREKIVENDVRFDKRSMRYRKFYNAISISKDHVRDMGKYEYRLAQVKTQQMAAARRQLDMVALGTVLDAGTKKYRLKTEADGGYLGGILGTNYKGEGGLTKAELDLTYASYKLGKGNLVPIDYKTTGSGVSSVYAGTFLDKVAYARRRLEELDVFDPTVAQNLCVCISPAVKQMVQSYELKLNRDYGFSGLGEAGSCTYLEKTGINWVVSNMLPTMDTEKKDGTAVPGARMCCMWLKDRVGFGVWDDWEYIIQEVTEHVDVRERSLATGYFGCARKDDDSVFVLPELETLGV